MTIATYDWSTAWSEKEVASLVDIMEAFLCAIQLTYDIYSTYT